MSAQEILVEGRALLGEELGERPVTLVVRAGRIHHIEEMSMPHQDMTWICPAFFNAHTHIGDSLAMDLPAEGSLEDLVTPPHGLKHRILAQASPPQLIAAMRASIRMMENSGTAGFADFREGGIEGVNALMTAAEGFSCIPVIFGRDGGEFAGRGFGVSSARDVEGLEQMVSAARSAGKMVAFHAGERDSYDIDAAIEFDPDLLIHCTHATDAQLRRCSDEGIPIAVCPRANWRLGVAASGMHPPVGRMRELGCDVLLGTDNVMFVQPDLWRELSFLTMVYRVEARDALRMAIRGANLISDTFFLKEGNKARFLIIDPRASNLTLSRDMPTTLVNRAGPDNIVRKVINL